MKNQSKYILINVIILFIMAIIVLLTPNNVESLQYIGIAIIFVSICMMIRYRKCTSIALLVGIMMIISICFALSVCFNTYETAFNWQTKLINKEANIINAKNYLLFLTVLSISIGGIKEKDNIKQEQKSNLIIVIGGFIILLYALIFGIDRGSVGTYISNTNTLYEYAIVLFLFVWNYSKDNKIVKVLLIIYAILYCLQGLIYGDRSSCFPMILMVFLLTFKKKYTMKHIIIAGLGGIFLANIIDVFRNTGDIFSLNTLKEVINRGLFVNTISYAFYGGTQIIRYGLAFPERITSHFFQYITSFITGGSNQNSLTVLADSNGFANSGGGMTHTYFYYWGGYIATIIGAILIGRIIHYIFNKDNEYTKILRVTVTIFLIRWFLYYPIAFFRTAIIIPIVCCFICRMFTQVLNKGKKGFEKNE